MLMKGLDDILFSITNTRFLPPYFGAKAVPQLPQKCNGVARGRNDRSLEAVARYHTGI